MNKSAQYVKSKTAFITALHDYQKATRDMNLAINKLVNHSFVLYQPLKTVVQISGAMITPRHLDRQ